MTLTPLFAALSRREIRLCRDGDEFTVKVRPGCDGAAWLAYVQHNKPELLHILALIQQAYPEGVPAQVPLDTCCALCHGGPYPAVPVQFKNGSSGMLCVACYVKESAPNVNRSLCQLCEGAIGGLHHRDLFGGAVCCDHCFYVKLSQWRAVLRQPKP